MCRLDVLMLSPLTSTAVVLLKNSENTAEEYADVPSISSPVSVSLSLHMQSVILTADTDCLFPSLSFLTFPSSFRCVAP